AAQNEPHLSEMFQNTGAGALSMPSTFLRMTAPRYHCPNGMCVTTSPSRTDTCSAMAFCLPGSVSRAKSSRSFSIAASHGQPNIALSQAEFMKPVKIGLVISIETQEVKKACQRP